MKLDIDPNPYQVSEDDDPERQQRMKDRLPKIARPSPAYLAKRLELVARYRLQGMQAQEIADRLVAEMPPLGPVTTSQPCSLKAVGRTIRALEEMWLKNSERDTRVFKAEMLAEIGEAKRQTWEKGDLHLLPKAWSQESKILGLDSPTKLANADGSPIVPSSITVAGVMDLKALVDIYELRKPKPEADDKVEKT